MSRSIAKPARRNFLKAAGIAIALPTLESVAAPRSRSPREPMRMVCIGSALGIHPDAFFPTSSGPNFELSPTLQPLSGVRGEFTVFSHLDHPAIYSKHGATSSFLSGVGGQVPAGANTSMDQIAADHVGYATRFPSLHVSLGGSLGCSWTKSGIKVREDSDPRDLFNKLFVRDSAAAAKARQLQLEEQGSILDLVGEQAKRFERRANPSDKQKLDEYVTAIREAEAKLQGMKRWIKLPKPIVSYEIEGTPHSGMDYEFLSPLMFDLLFLAIQSDSSRVFTAGFGMHNHAIEFDGVKDGYHTLSHHGNLPDRLRQLQLIDRFYIDQMARLVQKLKDAPLGERGNGTLLDQTMVMFGSGMGDAARHSNRNLPVVLAGGGLKHHGHLDCQQASGRQTPLNNLYTSMLQNFGVDIDRFNGATGTIHFG